MNKIAAYYFDLFIVYFSSFIFLHSIWPDKELAVIAYVISVPVLYVFFTSKNSLLLVDKVLLLLPVYELVIYNLYSRQNRIIDNVLASYISVCFYFILRFSFTSRKKMDLFLKIISWGILFYSFIGIYSFWKYQNSAIQAGFLLDSAKYLYRPLGLLNNVWGSTVLGCFFIIFIYFCFSEKNLVSYFLSITGIVSLTFNLIITFSRGIYISFGIFLIAINWSLICSSMKVHLKTTLIVCELLIIVGIITLYHKEVMNTSQMIATKSQQRSLETRIDALRLFPDLIKNSNNKWLGIGNNRYSLVADKYIYENDNNSFSNFCPNIIIQLIIEKGIVGFIIWSGVFFIVIWTTITRKKNKKTKILFIWIYITIFLRELSFSCYLGNYSLQLILMCLLALYLNEQYLHTNTIK